jgi:hypothetical protein
MSEMQLNLQIGKTAKPLQDVDAIGLGGASILDALSQFDPYGAWRLDVETGLTYWTRDVFAIHDLPFSEGPVDVLTAIAAYHPEDRAIVHQCIEEAVAKKTGFRFVLRLADLAENCKLVKATGLYRESIDGKPELYGTFSQFQPPIRSVAITGA